MKVLLSNTLANKDEFEALHNSFHIGGSKIAIVCGKSKWTPTKELFNQLTKKTETPDIASLPKVRLGILMEPVLGILFQDKMKGFVAAPNTIYQSEEFEYAIATPDFFWYEDSDDTRSEIVWDKPTAIVEAKNAGIGSKKFWSDMDAPQEYVYQLNWTCGICGISCGYFSALCAGNMDWYFTPRLIFDVNLFKAQMDCCKYFVDCLQEDKEPDDEKISFLMGGY